MTEPTFRDPAPSDTVRGRKLPRKQQLANLLLSSVATAVSLLGTLFAAFQSLPSHPPQPIQERLRDLDRVRTSLAQLDRYVQDQQKDLAATASSLETLKRQKEDLDRVVAVNRESVEALLRFQDQRHAKANLLAYAMSFVLGVFSSLTATLLVTFLRRRRIDA